MEVEVDLMEVASKAMERCMYSQLQQSLQISPLVGQGVHSWISVLLQQYNMYQSS